MSSIQSIQTGLIPAARLSVRRADDAPAAVAPTASKTDSVELSTTRRLPYDQIPDQGFNSVKVDKIRAAIRDGSYLTPDKYTAAVNKLQADLELLP